MESQLVEIGLTDWGAAAAHPAWTIALEAGKVLYFSSLAFRLLPGEGHLLTPSLLAPDVRNISLDAAGKLKGAAGDDAIRSGAAAMIGRFRLQAEQLVHAFVDMTTGRIAPDDGTEPLPGMKRLAVFSGIRDLPMRVKCAILPWHTLQSALNSQTTTSTEDQNDPMNTPMGQA